VFLCFYGLVSDFPLYCILILKVDLFLSSENKDYTVLVESYWCYKGMTSTVVYSSCINNNLCSLFCLFAIILHIGFLRRGDNATFTNTRFLLITIGMNNIFQVLTVERIKQSHY